LHWGLSLELAWTAKNIKNRILISLDLRWSSKYIIHIGELLLLLMLLLLGLFGSTKDVTEIIHLSEGLVYMCRLRIWWPSEDVH
jgi:hypothetical protein